MAITLASTPQTVARNIPSTSAVVATTRLRSAITRVSFKSARNVRLQCRAMYKVEIEHEGEKHMLEVPEGETILNVAIDAGIDVPYDCQLGVCMTCPAKLVSGKVDQDQGMLSDDVKDRGYALMCVAIPQSDCSIRSIPEEELLSLQLATADD